MKSAARYAVAAVILARLWVAKLEPKQSPKSLKLDLQGALLLGGTLLSVLFPIVEFNEFHSGWLFLLFVRVLPAISIAEMRELVSHRLEPAA